jgi:hypothetical protein
MSVSGELPEDWRDVLRTCDFDLAATTLREVLEGATQQERDEQGPGDIYFEPTFFAVLKGFLDAPSLGTATALLERAPMSTIWQVFEMSAPGGMSHLLRHLHDDDEPE